MLPLQDPKVASSTNRKARRAARKAGKKISGAVRTGDGTKPDLITRLMADAQQHRNAGCLPDAERCYREAITAEPQFAEAYFQLGTLFQENGQADHAYGYYKQAVTLKEDNPAYWLQFGGCLAHMRERSAAVIAFERVVALLPNDYGALIKLGEALNADDRATDALAVYEQALQIDPGAWQAHYGKAEQHFALGEFAVAQEAYHKALEINPDCAAIYFRLVGMIEDHDALDSFIERVEQIIAKGNDNFRFFCQLHFAVAIGHRRRKRFDEAFTWFAAGNDLRRDACKFDQERYRGQIKSVIEGFRPEVFQTLKEAGSDSELPIFIVGVPRSGSTLVEQILSSHPHVADAGEFSKFGTIVRLLSVDRGNGISYPRSVGDLCPKALRALGEDYLGALQYQHSDQARRITDKQLSNIFHLGLIAILFPNAAIIHCRRDPMDTCLSCYFQNFREPKRLAWTNDLEDLGFYYRQYERMADHWRAVLPGRMFEVNYEDMVADQERMSRKLIEHVGLPWDDACLDFHKSERGVRTASASQVRKPIYKSSIGAWRNYAQHLTPLKKALGIDASDPSAA